MVTAAIHIANFWRMMSNVLKNIASSPANVRFAWIGFQPFGAESRASFRPAVTSNIRSLGGAFFENAPFENAFFENAFFENAFFENAFFET